MQASLPAGNPRPMHQFQKPARNKLVNTSRPSSPKPSKKHIPRESATSNLGLFTRLSSFSAHGNNSGGTRRIHTSIIGSPTSGRRPSRDGLDWFCRGSYEEITESMIETQSEYTRTPSLTHSRASSSDSGSGSSVASSQLFKPLPELPGPSLSTDGIKHRPASVAVLEQIDELSVPSFQRKNSAAGIAAHIFLPHLDLAASEEQTANYSPVPSSNLTPRIRQIRSGESSRSPSPSPGWTPRGSETSMNSFLGDDSLSGPFALEASLARQEGLSEGEEDDNDTINLQQSILPSLNNLNVPAWKPSVGKPDFSSFTWDPPSVLYDAELLFATPPSPPQPQVQLSPALSSYVMEDTEDSYFGSSRNTNKHAQSGRQSVKAPRVSRGGWRGWRSASQPQTPADEVPPSQPSIQVSQPTDYFFGQAAALPEISPTDATFNQHDIMAPDSPKPRLSPEFTFGRRTPSPNPGSRSSKASYTSHTNENPTIFKVPSHYRHKGHHNVGSRAASEDHIALDQSPMRGQCRSTSPGSHRLSYRTRLTMRQRVTHGPRHVAHSFDADQLRRLRESGSHRKLYDWI